MFSLGHIIWIVVSMLLAFTASIFVSKKFGWSQKVLIVMCCAFFLSESTYVLISMQEFDMGDKVGYYLKPEYLPLHLCSLQIVLLFILTFCSSQKLKRGLIIFMYPTSLSGATMAILIPSLVVDYGFFNERAFQFFISHMMLVFLGLYMLFTRPIKFDFRTYLYSLGALGACLIFAIYINSMFGGPAQELNFWFIAYPPMPNLPLLNLEHGWYIYVINLALVGFVLTSLTYVPIVICWFKNRNSVAILQ
ncbi:MAG: YwaF family protein [Clostridiales bacterium]|jgi:hypothetical protein|nr:YwaF family protein [Clostridiales bacterium]